MLKRKHNKYDDLLGIAGGAFFVWLSEIDRNWGIFWFAAGVLLIGWSVVSMFVRRRG